MASLRVGSPAFLPKSCVAEIEFAAVPLDVQPWSLLEAKHGPKTDHLLRAGRQHFAERPKAMFQLANLDMGVEIRSSNHLDGIMLNSRRFLTF